MKNKTSDFYIFSVIYLSYIINVSECLRERSKNLTTQESPSASQGPNPGLQGPTDPEGN